MRAILKKVKIMNQISPSFKYEFWKNDLLDALSRIECTGNDSARLDVDIAFRQLHRQTKNLSKTHNNMFLIGNGASSSMASHIAADLCKNGHIATRCFTDASLLTALANDCGVEEMFAEPLRRQGSKEDMLVCISSSGESPNILNAVKQARKMGMYILTFSGMNEENSLRKLGDLNFYVPAKSYGFVETAHAALLHYWVDTIVEV
jgi:D-sedoheptulose 7-phosphate isomerase